MSPGSWPATTGSSAARVFDHGRSGRHGQGRRGPDRQPALRSWPTPARRWPTCSPCASAGGSLAGRTLAWVGDGNNVARSLTLACGLAGIDIRLACPPGHELDPVAVDGARAPGRTVTVTTDPAEAVTAPTPCTPTSGCPWARRTEQAPAAGRLRGLPGRRGPDGRAAARGRVPALPAGPPRSGGQRGGDRRAGQRRVGAGREPHARRPGPAVVAGRPKRAAQ